MFNKDELSTMIAALEHYRREQTKHSVTLWRKNEIKQAQRLDNATKETIALMDKCAELKTMAAQGALPERSS